MGSGAAHREVTEEAGQEEESAMKITLNIQGFCVLKPSAWGQKRSCCSFDPLPSYPTCQYIFYTNHYIPHFMLCNLVQNCYMYQRWWYLMLIHSSTSCYPLLSAAAPCLTLQARKRQVLRLLVRVCDCPDIVYQNKTDTILHPP